MGKYDELVGRLRSRAEAARSELFATALGDALHFEEAATAITTLEAELAAMKARGDRLARYVRHEGGCGLIGGYGECTCGLTQALTEWRQGNAD